MGLNQNSVVLVTGCSGGIGRHLAERFLKSGCRAVFTDINRDALDTLVEGLDARRVRAERLDVRREDDWERVIDLTLDRFGNLDLVVNNAGVIVPGYVHEAPLDRIAVHLDVNLKGVMLGTCIAARHMVGRRAGHIINIASLAGIAPVAGISFYSASKFGVRGFSLAAGMELRPHGVYVTTVCPDAVQTPMLDLQIDYKEAAMTFSGNQALTVERIGDVIFNRAIPDKPLEIVIPPSRGLIAKLFSLFPSLGIEFTKRFTARGMKKQEVMKKLR